MAFLRYTDKTKILLKAADALRDNPFEGNIIGISEDFTPKTQEKRKKLVPLKKLLKKKIGGTKKVFMAYPAILKYEDDNGRMRIAGSDELAKLEKELKISK